MSESNENNVAHEQGADPLAALIAVCERAADFVGIPSRDYRVKYPDRIGDNGECAHVEKMLRAAIAGAKSSPTPSAPAPARETAAPVDVLGILRRVSADRCNAWMKGKVPPLTFQSTELAEEAGEVCGAVKKLARHEMGVVGGIADTANLREELADVIICADLIAARFDIDLWRAVCDKFNATSEKRGFPHRLSYEQAKEPVYVGDLKDPPFDGELKPPGHSDWTKLSDSTPAQRDALTHK